VISFVNWQIKVVPYIVEALAMISTEIHKSAEKRQFQDIRKLKIPYVHLSETSWVSPKINPTLKK